MRPEPEHISLKIPGKKIDVPIYIGNSIFSELNSNIPLVKYSKILVVIDKNVFTYWSDKIREELGTNIEYLIIPSGEQHKTLATIEKIWTLLSKKEFDRKSIILNIGGGVVCDLGGFAASTFMRGIPYVNIPTTLLAQADAAIGGKTGFNFNSLKNTIGTVSFPVAVFCDTNFLSTLPEREYRSGFAEIIKHAIIADGKFFGYLSNNLKKNKDLVKLLSTSCHIKCNFVNKDPYEKGIRKALNFGHTFGHAIEIVYQNTKNPGLHGEAVAIGMIAESRMSFLSGNITEKEFQSIENLVYKTGLPVRVSVAHKDKIYKKMLSDKKNVKQQLRWAFLEKIGKVSVDVTLPDDIIMKGLNYILE